MNKDKYIDQEMFKIAQSSLEALLPYGAFFLMLLGILDYFVTPENFTKFLLIRLIAASAVLILFLAIKIKKTLYRDYQFIITVTASIIPAVMVEAMVLSFGGHQSPYYAGMIVVITFVLGFLIVPFKTTLFIGLLIYAIYVVPILLLDDITNIRLFMNNNIFLTASAFGAFGWKYYSQKLMLRNFSLQYDLQENSKHLEIYSLQLKSMVEDRTKELSKSNKWHQALFDNATDGIVVLDRNGIIMNVNERACEMHGFSKEALVGSHSGLLEVDENAW